MQAAGAPDSAGFGLLVLTRRLLRAFTLAYIPFGPGFDPVVGRGEFLSTLARALRPQLPRGTFLLRFDLPWEKSGEAPAWSRGRPRVGKSPDDIQPPDTVVVDISPPLDRVLASMKQKTRYNVRLAAKKGVDVREGGPGDLDAWYALYRETGARDRIAIHSASYYRGLFALARGYEGRGPSVKLFLAGCEGELLAGNIVAFWKSRAAYMYGASSGEKRNVMPTYALQWETMRAAKEAGCLTYDLSGIPPEPDAGHPMHGLYRFKTGFSERILRRWGTWDAPYSPALHAGYRTAESVRMFLLRSARKRLGRRGNAGAG